jgi:hypothetical protein
VKVLRTKIFEIKNNKLKLSYALLGESEYAPKASGVHYFFVIEEILADELVAR